LTMRLPVRLASQALAAWRRDDDGQPADPESAEQRILRYRAGALALIGLAVEQTGRADGDEIICELDAWFIGTAMEAADEYGLLGDRTDAGSFAPEPGTRGGRQHERGIDL
jgi:hypothetical protein